MNLLPPETKNEVRKEYKRRFLIVALVLLSCLALIWIVISMPYFFSVYFGRIDTEQKMIGLENENLASSTKQLMDEFTQFTKEMELLKPGKGHASTTELLRTIISRKPDQVTINSFLFSKGEKANQAVISGVAEGRESLLSFAKKLSDTKIFSAVDLPVSDFSKKTDIDYSITLTIEN